MGEPTQRDEPRRPGLSRGVLACCCAVAIALVAWFFFAWLALKRMLLDAAGESIGTALVLLVVLSISGAVWRSREASSSMEERRG